MRFSMLLLISILLSFLAQCIGECAGAAFMKSQNTAVFVGGFIPLPMILFGGFLVKISRMPVYLRPLSWFSLLRFSFEAMMISIYGFNRLVQCLIINHLNKLAKLDYAYDGYKFYLVPRIIDFNSISNSLFINTLCLPVVLVVILFLSKMT